VRLPGRRSLSAAGPAPLLAARLYLTGGEIADLAGLPNGTHSATCDA